MRDVLPTAREQDRQTNHSSVLSGISAFLLSLPHSLLSSVISFSEQWPSRTRFVNQVKLNSWCPKHSDGMARKFGRTACTEGTVPCGCRARGFSRHYQPPRHSWLIAYSKTKRAPTSPLFWGVAAFSSWCHQMNPVKSCHYITSCWCHFTTSAVASGVNHVQWYNITKMISVFFFNICL